MIHTPTIENVHSFEVCRLNFMQVLLVIKGSSMSSKANKKYLKLLRFVEKLHIMTE